jgi:hypothetical protein
MIVTVCITGSVKKKVSCTALRLYKRIFQDSLRGTTTLSLSPSLSFSVSEVRECAGRNANPTSPEYNPEALPLQPSYSYIYLVEEHFFKF